MLTLASDVDNAGDHGPLEIVIAGAGIGGLCAAIGLRQRGHHVRLYEQSRIAQETGAAIHIAPNCNGLLKRMGIDARQEGSVEFLGVTEYDSNGNIHRNLDTRPLNSMWQHPYDMIHRAHLHTALKNKALSSEGAGRPVELHLQSGIASVDPDEASLTLKSGSTVKGDLVIGADGVHSVSRHAIPGGNLAPFDCGKSAYRFLVPTAVIAADPVTAPFLEKGGHLLIWMGEDRRLVMYPCVRGTVMNFVAIHPSIESSTESKVNGWQQAGNKRRMIETFRSFGTAVAALLDKADETEVKLWTLLDMEKMPTFVHGRLAVLGDAAHPFLPHQGQGGAQAIEDAMSLAALLPLGTAPQDILERLQLYNSQRYERSHSIQYFTRISGEDLSKQPRLDRSKWTAYNVAHDEWDASVATLRNHLATKTKGTRWRAPYGFGPAPGPGRPMNLPSDSLKLRQLCRSNTQVNSNFDLRFRTSRTFLQCLLPPGIAFVSPATICEASLSCSARKGVTWLGGHGHNVVSLLLHGTKYTKADGEVVFGSYKPLIFDNSPDSIVAGRDDLGMPTSFADISINHVGEQAQIDISWHGKKFTDIALLGLKERRQDADDVPASESTQQRQSPPAGDGTFHWTFVPAVGESAKPDAGYAVFVPRPKDRLESASLSVIAEDAKLHFDAGDWESLPTLHHITRFLAGMPQYGLVSARYTESDIRDEGAGAYRIE